MSVGLTAVSNAVGLYKGCGSIPPPSAKVYGVVSVVVTRLSVKQKTRVRFPTSPQT